MVGGFFELEIVCDGIKMVFLEIWVINFEDVLLFVLKGGVLFGYDLDMVCFWVCL